MSEERENVKVRKEMDISMESWILPSELTLDIFFRLPIDSVISCRGVCTELRELIYHPSFAHMHLQRLSKSKGNNSPNIPSHIASDVAIGLLFCFIFSRENGNQMYYGEYCNQHDYKLTRINQPPVSVSKLVVGSCYGLICFSETNHFGVHEPSYICNPITREYVNLPRMNDKSDYEMEGMVCGFGYHPSINKFKIVKICHFENEYCGRVMVYTLGSGSGWRDVRECASSLQPGRGRFRGTDLDRSPFGKLANGALHWLNQDMQIVSFDLAKENLYLLPKPPIRPFPCSIWDRYKLQVLGGCLCFVHVSHCEYLLEIWFLRRISENSRFDVTELYDYDSPCNWIKEFSIRIGREAEPCALTNNGGVLLHYKSSLFRYDRETSALEKLTCDGLRHVFPYVKSLVSLKALGEDFKLRKRYDVNPAPKEIFIKPPREEDPRDT